MINMEVSCYRPIVAAARAVRRFSPLLPLLIAVGMAGAAIAPPPAHADIFTPSAADQIKLGDQAAAQLAQQNHLINDSRASHLVAVCTRLLRALGPQAGPWHWSFHLIQSNEINAFALPGGNVYMYSGLYDRLHNDNEIAAVMAHEMTHVRLQHWAHQYASQQKRQYGLMILLGLAHANNTMQTLAGVGDTLYTLKFSRSEEEQADMGGLQDMVQAGYNPNGMLQLFQVLQSTQKGGALPEFLSDHPLTSHRVQAARAAIRRMGYTPIAS
ncbi:MAG: M48 family metalloprotease [Chloroflexi bacterium]|nr:M48 family metalloprotease [Chloroflexota bacterium]